RCDRGQFLGGRIRGWIASARRAALGGDAAAAPDRVGLFSSLPAVRGFGGVPCRGGPGGGAGLSRWRRDPVPDERSTAAAGGGSGGARRRCDGVAWRSGRCRGRRTHGRGRVGQVPGRDRTDEGGSAAL